MARRSTAIMAARRRPSIDASRPLRRKTPRKLQHATIMVSGVVPKRAMPMSRFADDRVVQTADERGLRREAIGELLGRVQGKRLACQTVVPSKVVQSTISSSSPAMAAGTKTSPLSFDTPTVLLQAGMFLLSDWSISNHFIGPPWRPDG